MSTVPPNLDSELNAMIREQAEALREDTRAGAEMLRKYQEDSRKRIAEYQDKMFRKDPKDDASPAVQIALKYIEQKLLAMPMLAPYVVQFVKEKIEAVGNATKDALGPLPEVNAEQLAELLKSQSQDKPSGPK